MDLELLVIYAAVFIFITLLVFSVWLLGSESRFIKKRALKKRLLYMAAGKWHGQEKIDLYRKRVLKDANFFVRMSLMLPRIHFLDRLIASCGLEINSLIFILASIFLGATGGILGKFLQQSTLYQTVIISFVFAFIPYLYLKNRAATINARFMEQFPEALDLLSRALRAGHAFTAGLSMVSDQMEDPIRREFGAVVDEVNFGLSLKDALLNLCERRPSKDLRFFAVAVLIQAETGGNVAEIMDNISRIMRQRIQFKRHVDTLMGEGKVSAFILLGLPVVMFFYLYFANFSYVSLLWTDEMGRYLLIGAISAQIIGAFVMKKMIDIEI